MENSNFTVVSGEKDGKPVTGILDVSAAMSDAKLPASLWLQVFLHNPGKSGQSNNDEAEILNRIEDRVESLTGGRFVGRMTFDGIRDAYFYVPNSENVVEGVTELLSKEYPSYKIKVEVSEDADWQIIGTYLKKI